MIWDFADQLKEVQLDLSSMSREYYTYTIGGGKDFGVRTRKVTEQNGKIKDRIYIGDYEIYRDRTIANGIQLERSTLHIQDDKGRIALIDTLTIENGQVLTSSASSVRYTLSNHLGSSSIELTTQAELISYEEYFPFGSSSYRSGSSSAEVALKRYRYIGKEKDENTGLYYYGARYYLDWICRFISVDDLKNEYPYYTPFQYAGNMPVTFIDLDGLEPANDENDDSDLSKAQVFFNEEVKRFSTVETVTKSILITEGDKKGFYETVLIGTIAEKAERIPFYTLEPLESPEEVEPQKADSTVDLDTSIQNESANKSKIKAKPISIPSFSKESQEKINESSGKLGDVVGVTKDLIEYVEFANEESDFYQNEKGKIVAKPKKTKTINKSKSWKKYTDQLDSIKKAARTLGFVDIVLSITEFLSSEMKTKDIIHFIADLIPSLVERLVKIHPVANLTITLLEITFGDELYEYLGTKIEEFLLDLNLEEKGNLVPSYVN